MSPDRATKPMTKGSKLNKTLQETLLVAIAIATSGCGTYVARKMVQSPNSFPHWLTPAARVELAFDQNVLTNYPRRSAMVGPPSAGLSYRVIEPADFDLSISRTNWLQQGKPHYTFRLRANTHGSTNDWSASPRGTVLLLHGYGVAQFAMAPWALKLAQEGWRSVLVDLRGHGKSTGARIYYGVEETRDLRQLLDQLEAHGQLKYPVSVLGESFGAALALRLKASDERVDRVVAIAPYAVLSNAVVNIFREYAHWLPLGIPRAGLKSLPDVLKVPPEELDTLTELERHPVAALFVAGGGDKISPEREVRRLYEKAAPGGQLIVVSGASHESLPYFFDELTAPVLAWLADDSANSPAPKQAGNQRR